MQRRPIIAIDGPAGSGKSTVSKLIAKKLKLLYLDTGAMYRALSWLLIKENIDNNILEELLAQLISTSLVDIEIDGGINFDNCKSAIDAGANILVSGTTVFKSNDGDIKKNINLLKLK